MFSLPGRGFHQRVTLISSVPMTLDDVIVHVRQFIIALVSVDGCSSFYDPDGFHDLPDSYDVVSLFTKTPFKEAREIIRKRLENDKTLKKRTNLNVDDIMELLKFVLETTYFRFEGEIYQQKCGVAMGSPVSPIVVNLYMEDLEQKIIATAPVDCQPRNWKRYVDDVICLVHTGKAKKLQQHMNTVDPTGSIIFTREDEENNSMHFLDAKFTRNEDGSVKSTVYRKKTHTDQFLNFASHHPKHQKLGVVRTLMHRCETITSEEGDKKEEVEHLREVLRVCGYPSWALTLCQPSWAMSILRNYLHSSRTSSIALLPVGNFHTNGRLHL